MLVGVGYVLVTVVNQTAHVTGQLNGERLNGGPVLILHKPIEIYVQSCSGYI